MVRHEDALSRTFTALADPTRRAVIARLARGPASVGELAEPHAISVPGMLKHLRVLEDANLVRTAKDGRVRRCGLTPRPLRQATRWMERYRVRWERRFDALESFLQRQEETR